MLRITDIQEKLLHLIGWSSAEGPLVKEYLQNELTQSESGLYFQDFHPLLTFENIISSLPESITELMGEERKIAFSNWLNAKVKAGISRVITRYLNEMLAGGTTKNILENKSLFDGTSRIADTVTNKSRIVGFELVPIRSKGIAFILNRIGLHFTLPGLYKVYLFHSSSNKPLKVLTFVKKEGNRSEWFSLADLVLNYSSDYEPGGSYYLVYTQDNLPLGSKAIQHKYDWSKGPCRSCSRQDFLSWLAWSKYLEVHPFYVSSTPEYSENGDLLLWDIENNIYTYDTNYGINLGITIACDITDFIIEQRSIFTDLIGKQVAIDFLREFAYNPNVRTNRHIINASKTEILYELDGDSSSLKKSGLSYQLELAMKAIKLSTAGLDRICLPCKNNGIKYRVV